MARPNPLPPAPGSIGEGTSRNPARTSKAKDLTPEEKAIEWETKRGEAEEPWSRIRVLFRTRLWSEAGNAESVSMQLGGSAQAGARTEAQSHT